MFKQTNPGVPFSFHYQVMLSVSKLARAVEAMMLRAKKIYILRNTVNRYFLLVIALFSKRKRKHALRVRVEF